MPAHIFDGFALRKQIERKTEEGLYMEEEKEILTKREELHCLPELGGPTTTPWLIYPNGNTSHIFCNIFEPKKTCFKRIPELRRKTCVKSAHGWLVLLGSGGGCSMWNPVTLETIQLPSSDVKWDVSEVLCSCTLSSAPTEPGCMILFFGKDNQIMYCQPGDTQWTKQTYGDRFGRILHAIGFSSGAIYAWTEDEQTVIIDKNIFGRLSFILVNVILRPRKAQERTLSVAYFFESCGELFRVYLYFSKITMAVKFIGVHKLNFSEKAWVEVKDIGGQALFLTLEGTSCVLSSAYQHSGIEGDCIYFTIVDKSVYVFDMKDDSISVSLPCSNLRNPASAPFWFIPMTNNRMVDTTKHNDGRTITDDTKIMVQQSFKETSKEEEKVETTKSLFLNLPKELQHSIASRLTSVVDYMNFRGACKPLRSIAPPIRWRYPWLSDIRRGVISFLDPQCNSVYRLNTPELHDATIRSSKGGWFLMSKGNFTLFFFDPFTKTRINLPYLKTSYCFEGICFSSVPTSSDCVIFGIGQDDSSSLTVGQYHLGQKNWSYYTFDIIGDQYAPFSVSRSNPVFYDGGFYCLSHEGRLGVFDVNRNWTVLLNPQPCSLTSKFFLVECDGELLSVFVDDGGKSTIVSRFDHTMMDWVRVNSLSDWMLFLSSATSIALETQEKKFQNKIFLPRVWNKKNNDVVVYSLETEKYHSFSNSSFSRNNFYGTKEQWYCSWFQPNLVWRSIP